MVGGATPLHSAAYNGRVEAMKALVALGANKEAKNADGATPLYSAAASGQVEALVELGADIDAHMEDGETPLQISLRFNHHAAAQVLKALQRPIRMKKKAVPAKEPPTQEAIDAAERMAALLEEESEEEEEEREKTAAAKAKVSSRPAFSHPR